LIAAAIETGTIVLTSKKLFTAVATTPTQCAALAKDRARSAARVWMIDGGILAERVTASCRHGIEVSS
jgi:hypothetical protein